MKLKNFENRPLIIRSHYGDESIALVQWAYETGLKQVKVVTIDTGWAAEDWSYRVQLGEAHARACGFHTSTIVSPITFVDAVKGRGEFPSAKFQWCSALLKGLPFLDWLDTWDPACKAIILIAKRQAAAKAHALLPEWIEKCEFHNDRMVWHPLLDIDTNERDALLQRAGFIPLNHRTLECQPCVNSSLSDLGRLREFDIRKIQDLEEKLGFNMFSELSELSAFAEFSGSVAKFAEFSELSDSSDSSVSAFSELSGSSVAELSEFSELSGSSQDSSKHSYSQNNSARKKSIDIGVGINITELIKLAKQYEQEDFNKHYLDLFYRGCGNHFGCGL